MKDLTQDIFLPIRMVSYVSESKMMIYTCCYIGGRTVGMALPLQSFRLLWDRADLFYWARLSILALK